MSHGFGWLLGTVLVAGGVAVPFWWLSHSSQPATPEPETPRLPEMAGEQEPKKTEFATGGQTKDEPKPAQFDSERALKYLKQLCDIGPRISASDGMKKQQELIEKH